MNNKGIEKKLAELVEASGEQGPGAVFTVLHLLHGCYLAGKHNEFAKHCCAFSGEASITVDAREGKPEPKIRLQ